MTGKCNDKETIDSVGGVSDQMSYTSCLIKLVLFMAGRQRSSALGVIVRSYFYGYFNQLLLVSQ